MAECRACLVKNVRMHLISNTRYREMFEKLSGKKLSIEDGRPETICYICNAQLQRFWKFFNMSQKTENMLTTRLLFGIEMQGTLDITMHRLSTTAVKSVSFIDDGTEAAAPEVTITVKEELDEVDEWEQFKDEFKDEFMDSPSADIENYEYEPEPIQPRTQPEITKMADQKEIPNLESADEKELKNELLDIIKTESIENENTLNEDSSINLQNLSTEQFPIKADLKFHPKENRDNYHYCNKCDYRCQLSKTLRKHSKNHDPTNQFECTFCLYRFPDEKKLARHRNYCTVCNVCGKKFHNLNGLRIHVRLHTGEQPYSCDLCGRGFNQKTNLQTHLRVHAREKQYPCDICFKIFPFSSYLKRHMLIHSENHIDGESMHRIMNCHKLFNRKKKVMSSCTVCGKSLRKDSMSMHMRLHTGVLPFTCEKCNRCFNQKCNLLTHVERVHPGDDLFACKVCFKTFAMNVELRKHMVTHGLKVEIKKELIAQTEKTIKNFISRYEKEVEQGILTEADKKMELILNLGLKPIMSQVPNGLIVIPNLNERSHNMKATKRKGSTLDSSIKKAKRKVRELTVDNRNSRDSIVKGIKIEGFLPNSTKDNIEHNPETEDDKKIIKRESNLVQDGQENDYNSIENLICTDVSKELQESDDKSDEISVNEKKNTEKSNLLYKEDDKEMNFTFVNTKRNISDEGTQNIKEVEIKRELISENEDLAVKKVLLESVDENTKTKENVNLTKEMMVNQKDAETEEVSIKNELGDLEYNNEINSEDIEYFDESIEILEVEISDSEEYQNVTNQDIENEEITSPVEDSQVTVLNRDQNALADTKEENSANKKVLATENQEGSSQVLLSDENTDLRNTDACRQTMSYTGVEVSVIDPDDVDDSIIDSEQELNIEEEYLDLSDDELMNIADDSLDEEVPSDDIDLIYDAKDERDITDSPENNENNEPRIKLRSDLFRSEDNLNSVNLNDKDTIAKVNLDNLFNNDSNRVIFETNYVHSESIATNDHNLHNFTDAKYLDSDSTNDSLENTAILDNFDNINSDDDKTSISVQDFDIFQQKYITSVHRKINNLLVTPYPCDLCVTKVFSY